MVPYIVGNEIYPPTPLFPGFRFEKSLYQAGSEGGIFRWVESDILVDFRRGEDYFQAGDFRRWDSGGFQKDTFLL